MRRGKRVVHILMAVVFALCTFMGVLPITSADVVNAFYVAPAELGGSDSNDGTLESPFLTMRHAADAVYWMRESVGLPDGGVTVYMRGGEYFVENPIELWQHHSGTESSPVTFRSMPGERAVITGAKSIPAVDFQPVNETAKNRIIDATAQKKVVEVDLDDYGIDVGNIIRTGFGNGEGIAPAELFVDGVAMELSRWPNKGLTEIAATPGSSDSNFFQYGDSRIERWQFNNDLWIRGYFVYTGWGDGTHRITQIDANSKRLYTESVPSGGYNMTGRFYYYINILEELDTPGEYYIDRTDNKLYFYPPYNLEGANIKVSHARGYLLRAYGVGGGFRYINFKDLTFEGTKGTALRIEDAHDVVVDGCIFRDCGQQAVEFDRSKDSGVRNSEIQYFGGGGIYLNGGDHNSLTPGNLFAENNHITDYSRIVKAYKAAVEMRGSGQRATGNTMHDATHNAVLFSGSEMVVENNEVYDVTQEADDVGAFYIGWDYTYRGTKIRYNFIHDNMVNSTEAVGSSAIYLDDSMCSADVYGNIISNVHRAMHIGGGRDHKIYNNLIWNCTRSIEFDDRNRNKSLADLLDNGQYAYTTVPVDSQLWLTKYPEVAAIKKDPNPGYPKGNRIYTNVMQHSSEFHMSNLVSEYAPENGIRDNLLYVKDIMLVDPANYNFALSSLSPVYTDLPDFEPIDMTNYGADFEALAKPETYDIKEPANGAQNVDTSAGVYFAWQASAYADSYRLTIARDAQFANVVKTVETEDSYCTVQGLVNSGDYYWKVESIQDAWSLPRTMAYKSAYFTFSTGRAVEQPDKVTGGRAYRVGDSMCLIWDQNNSADSYRIYRSTNNGAFELIASDVIGTEYRDTAIQDGQIYRYQVKGINAAGEGTEADDIALMQIQDIDITRTTPNIGENEAAQVQVRAMLTDASTVDLTGRYLDYRVSEGRVFDISDTGLLTPKARGTAVLTVSVRRHDGTDAVKSMLITSYYNKLLDRGFEEDGKNYSGNRRTTPVRSGTYSVTAVSPHDWSQDQYYDALSGVMSFWIYDTGSRNVEGGLYLQPPEGSGITSKRLSIGVWPDNNDYYQVEAQDEWPRTTTPVKRTVGWHQIAVEMIHESYCKVYIDGVLCYTTQNRVGGFSVFRYRGDLDVFYFDDLTVVGVNALPTAVDPHVEGAPAWDARLTAGYDFYDYSGAGEQGSQYQWFVGNAADGPYTRINGATERTFVPRKEDAGKYLVCQIFPRSNKGTDGDSVLTSAIGPLRSPYAGETPVFKIGERDITESGMEAGTVSFAAKFRNDAATAAPAAIIVCAYDRGKPMQKAILQTEAAQPGVTPLDGTFSGLSAEAEIRVFYWDGLGTMHSIATPYVFGAGGLQS